MKNQLLQYIYFIEPSVTLSFLSGDIRVDKNISIDLATFNVQYMNSSIAGRFTSFHLAKQQHSTISPVFAVYKTIKQLWTRGSMFPLFQEEITS